MASPHLFSPPNSNVTLTTAFSNSIPSTSRTFPNTFSSQSGVESEPPPICINQSSRSCDHPNIPCYPSRNKRSSPHERLLCNSEKIRRDRRKRRFQRRTFLLLSLSLLLFLSRPTTFRLLVLGACVTRRGTKSRIRSWNQICILTTADEAGIRFAVLITGIRYQILKIQSLVRVREQASSWISRVSSTKAVARHWQQSEGSPLAVGRSWQPPLFITIIVRSPTGSKMFGGIRGDFDREIR